MFASSPATTKGVITASNIFFVVAICFLHLVSAQPKQHRLIDEASLGKSPPTLPQQRGLDDIACGLTFENCQACTPDECTLCKPGYRQDGFGGCEECSCEASLPNLECRACKGCDFDSDAMLCYSCTEAFGEGCTSCTVTGCVNCPPDADGNEQGVDEAGRCTPCPDWGTPRFTTRGTKGSASWDCEDQETMYGYTDFYNPNSARKRCCRRCWESDKKNKCRAIPTTKAGEKKCQWIKGKGKNTKSGCVPNDTCDSRVTKDDCKGSTQCRWTKKIGKSSRCYQKCEYAGLNKLPNCKAAWCVDITRDGLASCEKCKNGYKVCRNGDNRGQCVDKSLSCPE